jgi:hypothetical protein
MNHWLDIPLDPHPGHRAPTWSVLAERYDRCFGRVAFYVGQRVRDRGTLARIVTETLEENLELLVADHDDLEELRRLRTTADRLIVLHVAPCPGAGQAQS